MAKKETEQPAKAAPEIERVYIGSQQIDHDLYKLKSSIMKTNVSWTQQPRYVEAEHCHFFHSVDSDGRRQTHSVAIGGHFHEMMMIKPARGKAPAVYRCGPPVKEVRRLGDNGKWVKGYERLKHDDHVHDVEYINSVPVAKRTQSADATNVITDEAQKTAPIQGIIG